jgi:hypothetical protein
VASAFAFFVLPRRRLCSTKITIFPVRELHSSALALDTGSGVLVGIAGLGIRGRDVVAVGPGTLMSPRLELITYRPSAVIWLSDTRRKRRSQ